jgi:hypothetical protein
MPTFRLNASREAGVDDIQLRYVSAAKVAANVSRRPRPMYQKVLEKWPSREMAVEGIRGQEDLLA